MIEIRDEQPKDMEAIREVNVRAFGQMQEADLVDKLRQNCDDLLSLVAVMQNKVVAIFFSVPPVLRAKPGRSRGWP